MNKFIKCTNLKTVEKLKEMGLSVFKKEGDMFIFIMPKKLNFDINDLDVIIDNRLNF